MPGTRQRGKTRAGNLVMEFRHGGRSGAVLLADDEQGWALHTRYRGRIIVSGKRRRAADETVDRSGADHGADFVEIGRIARNRLGAETSARRSARPKPRCLASAPPRCALPIA